MLWRAGALSSDEGYELHGELVAPSGASQQECRRGAPTQEVTESRFCLWSAERSEPSTGWRSLSA
jgi:hypothetical protein